MAAWFRRHEPGQKLGILYTAVAGPVSRS